MTVLHTDRNEIWLEIGEVKVAGVYRKGDEGTQDIQAWITVTEQTAGIGRRLAIGDWNAHHPDWSLKTNRDNRGTQLQEGMTQLGLNVAKECFWETFRRGEQQK